MAADIPITPDGLAGVKSELEQLVKHRRPEIVAKIKAAREHGDLSENFEYHAARNEQSFVEGRIQELESIIRHHKLIKPVTVHFSEDGGPEEAYQLVGPADADPKAGRISADSAMGRALLQGKVGEEVEVVTDNGYSYRVKITAID
jgi:transcription elongation factor GreA